MFKIIKQLVKDDRILSKFWVSSDETWSGLPPFKTEAAATKKAEELESLDNFGAKYKITHLS
jgi:hypothetical protein